MKIHQTKFSILIANEYKNTEVQWQFTDIKSATEYIENMYLPN